MMDDETRAKVLREYAENWEEISPETANCIRDDADYLDPSVPDIPDGHVWYRYYGKTPQDWSPGLKFGATIINQYGQRLGGPRLVVIPARTLAPEQVAVYRETAETAESLLRGEEYIITADNLRAALDRDTEARR